MDGPAIENGAVRVQGERIVDVGPFETMRRVNGDAVTDLGERAILPGLINAHCHLDYTLFRQAIHPPASFSQWIQRINGVKRSFSSEDYVRSVLLGFEEARKWGTTSIVNIESFPEILPKLSPPSLRTWWFFELIDLRSRIDSFDFGTFPEGWLGGFGLSPHAPYTASMDLYARAAASGQLITTHLNESDDEALMFRAASGGLHDLLAGIGRDMADCGGNRGGSPLQRLVRDGIMDSSWIVAHLNELDEEDYRALARAKPHIAHCPRSHRYFKHRPFEYKRLRQLGLNLCLGTDSLASNDSLDLFAEMRLLRENEPWLEAEEILQTVTRNPAAALGCGDCLGKIAPGAYADLICVPLKTGSVYESVLENREPVQWAMVNGQLLDEEILEVCD
jgi:cytosine/adenosine deaminase-related metal-dependent hydrolase